MFRGIVLALVLLVVADVCLNDSALTHAAVRKITGLSAASSEAVSDSVYRRR